MVMHPMAASKPQNCTTPSEVRRTVRAPEAVVPNTVVGGLLESYVPISGELVLGPS